MNHQSRSSVDSLCLTPACLSNANNCSGYCGGGGGGGGGGQGLSTVDPRRYPEPRVYPACFPEPRSRTIVRVPRPGPIPARLQATGGKRLNIILVCERGATEPEQVFGYPDPRKARLGPLRAFRSPRRWVCGPARQAQPRSVRLFANFC